MAGYGQAFLTGVAIGTMAPVIIKANKCVLKGLLVANCLLVKVACRLIKGNFESIREPQQLAEDEDSNNES